MVYLVKICVDYDQKAQSLKFIAPVLEKLGPQQCIYLRCQEPHVKKKLRELGQIDVFQYGM